MLADVADRLPPIIVHRPTMRVIDGMHRVRAALLRDARHIEVRFFDGDEGDAFVLAVRMNVEHGLPLSPADRRAAADRIIRSYPRWSDRAIAAVTGLSAPTIAARRRRLTEKNSQSDTRIGKDGRIRPVDPSRRREAAARLLAGNPGASLRSVARQAGLSPETVRKVRAELNSAVPHHSDVPNRLPPQRPWTPAGTRAKDSYTAVQALLADPAFRSTESGRMLLRLLATSRALQENGTEFLDNIPVHSLGRLAEAARDCVREWEVFATEVEQRRARQDIGG
jgi:AraC-like DNA-binding protein